jgi:DNA-binding transcriptional MocR family regulator
MATILVPAGGDLVTIGGGTSSETLLATPAWTAALRNAPPRDPLEALRYADPLGEPHLREVIAARFAPSDDAAGRVIVTHGAVESLNLCFASAAAATGSRRVALESPGYFMLGPILNHLGLDPVPISRTRKGLDLEQLGRELKRAPIAALMLNTNHQNPVGTSLSLAERFEIAKLADERRFFVVEDDVYKGLGVSDETGPLSRPVDGDDPPSIASFVPERTAYVGSFSKSLGPALRVGFTIAPPSLFGDLRRRKFLQSLAGDAYTQNLVADFVDKRGYQKHLLEMREELGRRARIARAQAEPFERLGRFTTPYAGGLFWLFEFGHGLDAMDLYRRARQRNLLVSPGCYFRPVEDTSAVDDRWMRVNVSRCEGTTLSHALKVLSELAQSSG